MTQSPNKPCFLETDEPVIPECLGLLPPQAEDVLSATQIATTKLKF